MRTSRSSGSKGGKNGKEDKREKKRAVNTEGNLRGGRVSGNGLDLCGVWIV